MNNGQKLVFKTLMQMVHFGLLFGIGGQGNDFQNEVVYSDGSHSRCYGLKMVRLSASSRGEISVAVSTIEA